VIGLLAGHTAGRAGTVALIRWMPYAGDEAHAKAKPLARRVSAASLAVAVATVALLVGVLVSFQAPVLVVAAAVAAAVLAVLATGLWLRRRLGGYTGDGLGAAEQHAECAALLAVVAVWPWA
jgi:adenosylcobinamide-GDP ribazoletransferase